MRQPLRALFSLSGEDGQQRWPAWPTSLPPSALAPARLKYPSAFHPSRELRPGSQRKEGWAENKGLSGGQLVSREGLGKVAMGLEFRRCPLPPVARWPCGGRRWDIWRKCPFAEPELLAPHVRGAGGNHKACCPASHRVPARHRCPRIRVRLGTAREPVWAGSYTADICMCLSVACGLCLCGYITLGKVVLDLPPSLMLQPQGRAISLSGRAGMAGGLRGQESFWRTFYRNQGSMKGQAGHRDTWVPQSASEAHLLLPGLVPWETEARLRCFPSLAPTGRGEAPRCWGVGWGLPCLGHIQSVKAGLPLPLAGDLDTGPAWKPSKCLA
ncbi:hypothetical protein Cadr_000026266 [Camelus dromedarius]|uniref:Uncharacterized protein n=1 Tax=Camelus dromedarius TaxID=9838 RepID=A0A5N4CDV0_CAMDR|nr:hypothetical protein Cadr_000026266 [Camelus dromedarius]